KNGVSVVLDFPANTLEVRKWMRHIIDSSSCHHELHFLDTPDIICLQRLDNRNKSGEHEYNVAEEEFNKFSSYFVAPSDEERFNLIIHSPKS
ncbi:MAG: AAA family ATPase, partial [Bdellovibrionales bacterium]|nr:AAA family ATPase [Bdellovibrionales bacterium]